jgi:DNA-binding MarR family transcriptional regulator
MGVGELAGRLGVGLTVASQMVGDLDRAGLVERRQDEADRRRTIVDVASSARGEVARWVQTRELPMRRTLEALSPQERTAFLKGLRILRRELSQWG